MMKKERSIFHMILTAMLIVLGLEVLLLLLTFYFSNMGPQMNQNAMDIVEKQVENRSAYLENIMLANQDLSVLSVKINETTASLTEEGAIDLENLDDSGENAMPLLSAVSSDLISTLRSKSVTGIFMVLNTEDLDQIGADVTLPGVYIRDLDPLTTPSKRNMDLLLERSPIQLVKQMDVATDKGWFSSFPPEALEEESFIYQVFQAAYQDKGQLDAAEYGRWTRKPFVLKGDGRSALAYTIPLIFEDGTVYGVLGVEMLTSYMQSLIPNKELQNQGFGTYYLASTREDLSGKSVEFQEAACSPSAGTIQNFSAESMTLTKESGDYWLKDTQTNKVSFASVRPLTLYSRNAPFSGEQWVLVGTVETTYLFAFSNHVIFLMGVAIVMIVAVGLICSLIVSRYLARPISKLSGEVAAAQKNPTAMPKFSTTHIRELDQFVTAVTQLSHDVLNTSTKFLRIMEMASVDLGGYEVRKDSPTVYVTENFFSMLGIPEKKEENLTKERFQEIITEFESVCRSSKGYAGDLIYHIPLPDGKIRYVRIETTSEAEAQVGLVEDVTAVTTERLRIEHERDYDPLTGLYSRRAFQRESEAIFAQPEKLKHAALIMMDTDNLKHMNDTFGHDWGDKYIRRAGQCLAWNTPPGTLCARISGDEFNVLFYGYDSQEAIREEIRNLKTAVKETSLTLPSGRELHLSISGGIAWYPENSREFPIMKKYADFAMYQVKRTQKGELAEFDPEIYRKEAAATEKRQQFQKLIREELVRYYFQPIISGKTGETIAYEALMRVSLPMITNPGQVMELAREEGCLHEIERITMFKSAESYLFLEREGLISGKEKLFVNSVASQHMTEAESKEYARRFTSLQSRLVVEITEEEGMDSSALEIKRNTLGLQGNFALDDYGSGYSNEKNLIDLSPAYIKVDISIIRDIDKSQDKQQIVSNIVSYAHGRNMQIVAEGMETAAELETVLALGVDLLQGYFLARPAAVPSKISDEALAVIQAFEAKQTASS
ncbi:EAL domain-containing protein [Fusicatenibacter sp.]|uniref:EAL domain-containing protein n=1 Tax=Fusicatenibacter sp. TaxID=2773922 RepID=UPI00399B9E22